MIALTFPLTWYAICVDASFAPVPQIDAIIGDIPVQHMSGQLCYRRYSFAAMRYGQLRALLEDSVLRLNDTGHTNCATCLGRYLQTTKATRGTYPCPHCRKPFKANQPHQLFLEEAESSTQAGGRSGEGVCHTDPFHRQVASAMREATRLEHDQRRQTVQKAAKEMQKVTELMSGRDCLLVRPMLCVHGV